LILVDSAEEIWGMGKGADEGILALVLGEESVFSTKAFHSPHSGHLPSHLRL
jgi:hypothetical protein